MKLDHIGFVVERIDEFVETLRSIGFPAATRPVPDHDKNVNASFVPVGEKDEVYLEVLEPLDERSAVHNFLKRTGGGLHHLCFEVDDIAKALTTSPWSPPAASTVSLPAMPRIRRPLAMPLRISSV